MKCQSLRLNIGRHVVVALIAALAIGSVSFGMRFGVSPAQAEDQAGGPPIAAKDLTPQQFEALPPTAVIEIDGKPLTKAEFQARRELAIRRAFEAMKEKRSRVAAEFAAQRQTFLDQEKTTLDAANRKVQDEVDRLRAADAALHGPNWDARREQATALLKQASTAAPLEQSRLEKEAADLLAPARP
jgi:hypothetical protein